MSRAVKQPVGQKRLTNIAVVRLKKAGKRFEIACYRNKINDWRAGIEKDIDEVLQTTTVFANVGKGVHAKKEDLMEAFGTADEEKICLEILAKGDVQVSDKERRAELDNLFKDVAQVLVEKTINPDTGRPYTHTMLERALRDLHFNPDPKKSAKQQALEALPLLQGQFRIERARMRLRLTAPPACRAPLLELLRGRNAAVEGEAESAADGSYSMTVQVEPGVFRDLHTFMQAETQHQGRIEVLSFAVTKEGEEGADYASALAAAAAAAGPRPAAGGDDGEGEECGGTAGPRRAGAPLAAAAAARRAPRGGEAGGGAGAGGGDGGRVVYERGTIEGLPEAFASRRERFAELDGLQPGWSVELRERGDTVDAVFFSPSGERAGAYAAARRAALQWKARGGQ